MKKHSEYVIMHGIESESPREHSFSQEVESLLKEAADSASLDLSDPATIELFSELVKSGKGNLVIEKLADVTFSSGDDKQMRLLRDIAACGKKAWVRERVADWEFASETPRLDNLLYNVIDETSLSWVHEKLATMTLACGKIFQSLMVKKLLALNDGEWVAEHLLQGKKPDQLEPEQCNNLQSLIAQGEAKWVREQFEGTMFNFHLAETRHLFRELVKNGETKWVTERLDEMPGVTFDFKDPDVNTLLSYIALNEGEEWIKETFKETEFSLENERHCLFLSSCAEKMSDWVLKQIQGQSLDRNSFFHQSFFYHFANAGKVSFVLEQMEGAPMHHHSSMHSVYWKLIEQGSGEAIAELLEEELAAKSETLEKEIASYQTILTQLVHYGQTEQVKEMLQDVHLSIDLFSQEFFFALLHQGEHQFVQEKIGDQLDVKNPKHQVLKDALHFEKTGEMPSFSKGFVNQLRKGQEWSEKKERGEMVKRMQYDLAFFPSSSKRDQLDQSLQEFIQALPEKVLFFLKLTVHKHGWFSKEIARMVDTLHGTKTAFVLEMGKTGSELRLYGEWQQKEDGEKELLITFVNDIPASAAETWQEAIDKGIPVSPILDVKKAPKGKQDITRVYSRYCGVSIDQVQKISGIPTRFCSMLLYFGVRLKNQVSQAGIDHRHPHTGNITVEFIKKDHLEQSNLSVNDIPFDPDQFTYNMAEYLEHPDQWELVMRMIDWDAAQSSSSHG